MCACVSNTGTFQLRALFNGTPNYSQTTSATSSLGVGADPILYYYVTIAIVMAILFGVVGYIAFQKRRKKQREE